MNTSGLYKCSFIFYTHKHTLCVRVCVCVCPCIHTPIHTYFQVCCVDIYIYIYIYIYVESYGAWYAVCTVGKRRISGLWDCVTI